MSIYKTYDVVVVPFPFCDSFETKKRPALILSSYDSFGQQTGHYILAMITSSLNSPWPQDTPITDLPSCGLLKKSVIRLKLFTLDMRIIGPKIGTLSMKDRKELKKSLSFVLRDI